MRDVRRVPVQFMNWRHEMKKTERRDLWVRGHDRCSARPARPGAKTVRYVAKNHSALPGPVLTQPRDTVPGPVTSHAAVTQSVVTINAVELQPKVREDFTITEKTPTSSPS